MRVRIHVRGVVVLGIFIALLLAGVRTRWMLGAALAAAAIDCFTFSGLLGAWAPRAMIRRTGRLD